MINAIQVGPRHEHRLPRSPFQGNSGGPVGRLGSAERCQISASSGLGLSLEICFVPSPAYGTGHGGTSGPPSWSGWARWWAGPSSQVPTGLAVYIWLMFTFSLCSTSFLLLPPVRDARVSPSPSHCLILENRPVAGAPVVVRGRR